MKACASARLAEAGRFSTVRRSPLRTISSFGKGEARPQQLLYACEMPAIEGREQVEARDETLGVKADVEARRRFGALSVLEPASEVPMALSN